MQEDQKRLSRRHCLLLQSWFWVYHFLVIALSGFILYQLSNTYQDGIAVKNLTDYRYSLETVNLWKKGYIIDIRVVATNNCPEGYTPLINYKYEGTVTGCFCNSQVGIHNFSYVLIGGCSTKLIDQGCLLINSVGTMNLEMWKGGKLICLKRAQSLNFYNSLATTTVTGTILKKCAESSIYTVNTLPDINCPLTAVSNVSIDTSQVKLELDALNLQYLYFASKRGYPIADFKLTQYQFCPFFDQINISPNKNGNYILQKVLRTTPCTGKDPRIITFDQLNEEEFFTNNTRVYQKISALPGYARPSNVFIYKLGYIPYPSWTSTCRAHPTHHLTAAKQHLLFDNEIQTLKTALIIGAVCICIYSGIIRLFFLIRHCIQLKAKSEYNCILLSEQQISEQIPTLNLTKSFLKQSLLFFFEIILRFGVLFALMYALLPFIDDSVWIKNSFIMNCTDTFLANILRKYEIQVDRVSQKLVFALVIWCLLIIFDVGYFMLRVMKGDLQIKQQKIQVTIQEQIIIDQKMGFIEQQSSQLVLNKEKDDSVKIQDLDVLMNENIGETKINFYGQNSGVEVLHRKKKKKGGKKKRNLFKEDDDDE